MALLIKVAETTQVAETNMISKETRQIGLREPEDWTAHRLRKSGNERRRKATCHIYQEGSDHKL